MKHYVLTVLCLLLLATRSEAQVLQLITEEEARLPIAQEAKEQVTRAITRGPGISLASADTVTREGFPLHIVFEPRGGVAIEPESVRLLYMKSPAVDLTERLKGQIQTDGIKVPAATAPPGEHPFQVTVRDTNGRQSVKKFTLVVR